MQVLIPRDPFNKRVYFEIDVFKLLPNYKKTQTTFSLELTVVYVNEHNVHLNETFETWNTWFICHDKECTGYQF